MGEASVAALLQEDLPWKENNIPDFPSVTLVLIHWLLAGPSWLPGLGGSVVFGTVLPGWAGGASLR